MNGVINFIKPSGITSSDAVVDFKRLLGMKKVGHTGTLDPAAAGVLPITVGRGTRLFDYILNTEKVYEGEMLLGVETDTLDTCGQVLSRQDVECEKDTILCEIKKLTGEIMQVPPMYSAKKIGGQKLYKLARKGESVEVNPRKVTIHNFEMLSMPDINRVRFRARCSKGTYIRTLISDLGKALGCGACLALLIRTKNGNFDIIDGVTFEEAKLAFNNGEFERYLLKPDVPLMHFKELRFDNSFSSKFRNGIAIPVDKCKNRDFDIINDNIVRLYCQDEFIGLGRIFIDQDVVLVKVHCTLT